ncbi:sporulation protein YhbH [Aliibacillus thermotolerans]|uniref:Sporulation protein YhbH n=1 Tax=Aliibacillus thermotolerans TaxID=1834418 RepID=A0ABW0U5S5_9BACI|nr:sporulation protein YhbH [Aliibacillus thermotolerans]MDA3128552.1 sporulation protein YhbH [Aliibacillus thermotolerans]
MLEKNRDHFIVSKENWSLHRKGYQDQRRHQEKVEEAIKENLPDLITEENIIMSNGREVVRIPIRSLDEYKIRYNMENNKYAGQGDGDTKEGDVIARDPSGQKKQGQGKKAGDQAGEDYYEAEVSIVELEKLLFNEMELPNLKQKERDELVVEDIEFNDIRKQGLMGNIDKRRTILSAIKRNALRGKPSINPIYNDDLRFKTWNEKMKPESKAVIIAMMDTSGSMGRWEKFLARSFFFWMVRFLRTKYETVNIEFIAHHTEAKRVSEEDFFSKGESGGTICSSAYEKALETIEQHYSPEQYNIYPFHFSDGDNLTSDNHRALRFMKDLMELSSMVGYAEVNQYQRHSTLMKTFQAIEDERFRYYILKKKEDVFHALTYFFSVQESEAI